MKAPARAPIGGSGRNWNNPLSPKTPHTSPVRMRAMVGPSGLPFVVVMVCSFVTTREQTRGHYHLRVVAALAARLSVYRRYASLRFRTRDGGAAFRHAGALFVRGAFDADVVSARGKWMTAWKIDTAHSTISFLVRHMLVARVH